MSDRRVITIRIVAVALAIVAGFAIYGTTVFGQSGFVSSNGFRQDSVGAAIPSLETCNTTKTITVSATTTEIVPVVAGKKYRVCSAVFSRTDIAAVVATAKFVEGTGTNCATGQTNLTGVVADFASAAVGAVQFTPAIGAGWTSNVAGDAVCVTEAGAASSIDVTITYGPAY
jgi:hypothetical protein